jgi:hypothetical protein
MLAKVQAGIFADAQLALVEKYMALGYSDGIERVMANLRTDSQSDAEKYCAMAWLGGKYGSAFHSVFYTQQLLKELGIRKTSSSCQILVRMILPMPFRDCVRKYSAEYGIDPKSVYSLIKRLIPSSTQGPLLGRSGGLMQLMGDKRRYRKKDRR